MIGSEFGRYKVVERLGAGGMGEVYRAEDTTLGRSVALKFLAAHLLHDAEAKQRFLREARAAAAVRHPNICHVYEVGEENGKTFLAMDYLEGESLEERIGKGPLPLKDSLDIGRQIAEGLEAAHEKGIVHRDIKPANVMVDAKGRATILDFGLARLTEASKLTRADQTVGTAAYMSPEQIQGAEVDHRTDIWALGCVLYEMVAGLRPFKGQYDQALLYEVIHEQPEPLTGLRAGVPMELEFIVGKCLAKDREDRTGSTQEIARELRTLAEKLKSGRSAVLRASQMTGAVSPTLNAVATLPPDAVITTRSRQRLPYAIAAVCAVAFLAVTAVHFTETSPEQPVRRFSFPQPGLTGAAISPDGRAIVFVVGAYPESTVWLRAIGSETAREIRGTEGARPALAWSPDSRSIVFAAPMQAKRIAIDSGEALTLCDLPITGPDSGFRGVTWSSDGERIVFASGSRLFEVPARGGEPQVLVDRESGVAGWPHFSPAGDGRQALVYRLGGDNEVGRIMVLKLETGESSEIGPGGEAVYSRQGYLIHQPADPGEVGLFALPFSLASLQATGESFRIAEAGVEASVAGDGTLIYLDGVSGVAKQTTLVWRDRSGAVLETVGQPQPAIQFPVLSPDGRRVAVTTADAGTRRDIWVHDLVRSTKTRLTFDPGSENTPAWSPSGDQIVYWQTNPATNGSSLMRKAADGTGEAVTLVEAENGTPAPDWSRDGRYLVYGQQETGTYDVSYVKIGADGTAGKPMTFLATSANEAAPKLSPDGRFVAYSSDESGRFEIYVRPFPDGAGRWQASVDGGNQPRWSRDGKELFYVRDDTLLSVLVATGEGVTLGQPQELFQSDDLRGFRPTPMYDVSADGQRFLTVAPGEQGAEAAPPTIRVVQNWFEEFRHREGQ